MFRVIIDTNAFYSKMVEKFNYNDNLAKSILDAVRHAELTTLSEYKFYITSIIDKEVSQKIKEKCVDINQDIEKINKKLPSYNKINLTFPHNDYLEKWNDIKKSLQIEIIDEPIDS
ncbi:hypothetical protein QIW49_05625 [Francisellaceae bacterium CB300]